MNAENPSILSTKKLSASQKELLLNAGIGIVTYNAIQINLLDFEFEKKVSNAIFTSKNAVKAIQQSTMSIEHCFCVGDNTRKLLEQNGQNVIETAQNASDLAKIIVKKYQTAQFLFFCGNMRRDELPRILKRHEVDFKEKVVYTAVASPKKWNRSFDGILFFSPSGVQSYVAENLIGKSIAFCIGNTTASEALKHTKNVIIANKPSVENVIVQAVKKFRN